MNLKLRIPVLLVVATVFFASCTKDNDFTPEQSTDENSVKYQKLIKENKVDVSNLVEDESMNLVKTRAEAHPLEGNWKLEYTTKFLTSDQYGTKLNLKKNTRASFGVNGTSACNIYKSTARVISFRDNLAGKFSIKRIISTRKSCEGTKGGHEKAYTNSLKASHSFRIVNYDEDSLYLIIYTGESDAIVYKKNK